MLVTHEAPGLHRKQARVHAELRLCFFLPVVDAIDLGPLWPGVVHGALGGRPRQDLQLGDALAALAKRGAHAVVARVTAADHDHVLVARLDGACVRATGVEKTAGAGSEKFHGEVNAAQVAPFHRQIARLGGAPANDHSIVTRPQLGHRHGLANFHAGPEAHASLLHHLNPSIDQALVQLHGRNAVHEQAAHAVGAFVHCDQVPGAVQLVGAGQTRRA